MHRLTLSYLAGYLPLGGLGLLVCARRRLTPAPLKRLLWRHHAACRRDVRYYLFTVVARSFIVVVLTALYVRVRDPLFVVLNAIVLIGLLPSIRVASRSTMAHRQAES